MFVIKYSSERPPGYVDQYHILPELMQRQRFDGECVPLIFHVEYSVCTVVWCGRETVHLPACTTEDSHET
jgi:hypothetical protein